MRKIFTLFIAALCCATMVNATEGALPGAFTINANGDKIQFSQGNLQYRASDNLWRFAENQWDIIGDGNTNISATYNGFIDLFGWGTGEAPTTAGKTDGYPYFSDWGINCISNGGNHANLWRTPTMDEWTYLIHSRTDAENLFALATVNSIHGFILLPDNWKLPNGSILHTATEKGMVWNNEREQYEVNYEDYRNIYKDNIYTYDEWKVIEAAGAVFLPSAGGRSNTSVGLIGEECLYWSASPNGMSNAYLFAVTNKFIKPAEKNERYLGYSVRLVQPYDEHQSIDKTSLESKSVKCIKDGQLYIKRNGRTYNAQGAEVK